MTSEVQQRYVSARAEARWHEAQKQTARWVLGIDPGCPGALALLDPSGAVRLVREGPTREASATGSGRNRNEVDAPALHVLLRSLLIEVAGAPCVCAFENVHSMPGDGKVQAFSFGRSVQAWHQAAEVEEWPIVLVTPQTWQRTVPGITGTGDARKASYHAAALARWPDQRGVLQGPRGGARLDPAAALWIAHHAQAAMAKTCANTWAPSALDARR